MSQNFTATAQNQSQSDVIAIPANYEVDTSSKSLEIDSTVTVQDHCNCTLLLCKSYR